jgi:hypothetical protein
MQCIYFNKANNINYKSTKGIFVHLCSIVTITNKIFGYNNPFRSKESANSRFKNVMVIINKNLHIFK